MHTHGWTRCFRIISNCDVCFPRFTSVIRIPAQDQDATDHVAVPQMMSFHVIAKVVVANLECLGEQVISIYR